MILKTLRFLDNKIPSLNKMYLNNRYGGGRRLNPEVAKYKDYILKELSKDGDIVKYVKQYSAEHNTVNKELLVKLTLKFVYRNRFWSRDVTNLVKATEDALVNVLGIDDSRNISVCIDKIYNDISKEEFIVIGIELFTIDNYKPSFYLSKYKER